VAAAIAVTAQEATRDVSARQVVFEGVDHIFRERRGVAALRVREEGREVLANDAIEHGVMRPPGNIFCRRSKGERAGEVVDMRRAPHRPCPATHPWFSELSGLAHLAAPWRRVAAATLGTFAGGTAVFFAGQPTLGTATGYADTYRKTPSAEPYAHWSYAWDEKPNKGHSGRLDWRNKIAVREGMTVEEAKDFAGDDDRIQFFFYVKGGEVALTGKGSFKHRTAVFFSGSPDLGDATDLADTYVKLS
jgi:hypothetical protein